MPPNKGTKAYKEEYVHVYYGINPRTFTVDSAYQQRNGLLRGRGTNADASRSRTPEAEICTVWALEDIFGVPMFLDSADTTKSQIAKLKAKAAARKDEAEGDFISGPLGPMREPE